MNAVASRHQRRPETATAGLGLDEPAKHLIDLDGEPLLLQSCGHGGRDLTQRVLGPGDVVIAGQDRQGAALRILGEPPGRTLRQRWCGGAGHDPQLPLQREEAGVPWFQIFVEVPAELHGAEQGGDVIGGTVPAAVAFAVRVEACRELLAVVGFEVVKGPVAQVESELAELLQELGFKGVCGGGGDGPGTEGTEQVGGLLAVADEFLQQG